MHDRSSIGALALVAALAATCGGALAFDETKYPTASRVGAAAGAVYGAAYDPDHAYTFGLQRVIDGLGALIDTSGT